MKTEKYMGKTVGAEAGAESFAKLEPEQHKNRPVPKNQTLFKAYPTRTTYFTYPIIS
jgi:hypothetical protein